MISLPTSVVRSSAVRFIVNNNPFYVLSAMCMLAGLFMLNDSLHYNPIPAGKLLTLIATLNVYEWFIIGLSIFLLRRGVLRDGGLILLIEVFFLADVAFLNAELFTANASLAWPISVVLLGLAGAKLIVILRALEVHQPHGRITEPGTMRLVFLCSLAMLLLLFAIPGFLFEYANHHGGQVPAPILYAIWWIIGLLPALAVYLPRSQRLFGMGGRLGAMRAYLLIPFLSLIAHVAVSHWVYKTPFYSEDLTPLALGFAIFAARCDRHEFTRLARLQFHTLLPGIAIFLSLSHDSFYSFQFAGTAWTPMRLAFLAAAFVYIDGLFVFQRKLLALPIAACLALASLGSSPQAIATNATQSATHTSSLLGRILPTTVTQWGILAMVGSFFLLAIGAAISLNRDRFQPIPAPVPPPLPPDENHPAE
jgi:hypothetical protein